MARHLERLSLGKKLGNLPRLVLEETLAPRIRDDKIGPNG